MPCPAAKLAVAKAPCFLLDAFVIGISQKKTLFRDISLPKFPTCEMQYKTPVITGAEEVE